MGLLVDKMVREFYCVDGRDEEGDDNKKEIVDGF